MSNSSKAKTASQPYYSNGQTLTTPPLGIRVGRLFDSAIAFGALYLTTLFSFDAQAAAQASPFSTTSRDSYRTGSSPRDSRSGGSGGGSGSGGQRLGTMNDIRRSGQPTMPAPVRVCAGGACG